MAEEEVAIEGGKEKGLEKREEEDWRRGKRKRADEAVDVVGGAELGEDVDTGGTAAEEQ